MITYEEPWFERQTKDCVRVFDIFLASVNYQDWLTYIEEGDDDGAEAAYEHYVALKERIIRELRTYYGPNVTTAELEARAVGLIDGFSSAYEDGHYGDESSAD